MARNGWCTHPKRQHTTDVKILVRAGELACRNSWGGDMFQSKDDGDQPSQPDTAADLPGGYQEPAASRDDEVTSVITPPDRLRIPSQSVEEDRVVSDRPAPLRDDDDDPHNDAARQDQEERARIMARGSRDALLRARERHSHRRNRSSSGSGSDDDGDQPGTWSTSSDRVTTRQTRFSDRYRTTRRSQQAASTSHHDPVPRSEIEGRWQAPVDRFDSVPEVDPSFDLPGWRSRVDDEVAEVSAPEPAEPDTTESEPAPIEPAPVSAYEHVLQRARRVREGKQHKPTRTIRHSRINAHESRQQATYAEPVEPDDEIVEPEAEVYSDSGLVHDEEPNRQEHWAEDEVDVEDDEIDRYELVSEASVDTEDDQSGLDYFDDEDEFFATFEPEHVEPESEDNIYFEPAEPRPRRRGGWLSSFGLLRRKAAAPYDDATITRHSSALNDDETWDDVDREHMVGTRSWDDQWDDQDEEEYLEPDEDIKREHVDWPDVPEYQAERFPESPRFADREVGYAYDVAHDNTDEPGEDFESDQDAYIAAEAAPLAASRPMAAPRTEPWHRQRSVPELPDLDDNLFEETFERRRVSSPTATLDRAPAHEEAAIETAPAESNSKHSPSESYFRAARFRDWRESHASSSRAFSHASDRANVTDDAVSLPDLDESHLDLKELVARGSELLDMTIDIAPKVPRECRTCRSFRSADGGARGWCTNEWAFTHRRMVNEDDLACETTIGCWWLPADRYWLIEDQDGYAVPTPRMDELIARLFDDQDRRSSGAGA